MANHVILDEADTINLPNSSDVNSNFLWFVTTTYNRLYDHKNYGFIRNLFKKIQYDNNYRFFKILKNSLVIQNNEQYIINQ